VKTYLYKLIFSSAFIFVFNFVSFADHIVGGDLTIKWISGNNFEVTLNFFRDCKTTIPFTDQLLGLFDAVTNKEVQKYTLTNPIIDSIKLGDACYVPPTCIEVAVYKKIIQIANNTNGYYLSMVRCCRNAGIKNISSPSQTGYVMYCEIPNPALHNSSPTFSAVPDGYMCMGYPNSDSFTCTDVDGDQLKYSFSTPLSCSSSGACNLLGVDPKPYGTIYWSQGYSLANQMGDPNMVVDQATGVVTTTPPLSDLFVFCVTVEEFRAGVKIGEIRRDFQFQVLSGCSVLNVAFFPAPKICSGSSTTLATNGATSSFTYYWNPGGQTTNSIVVSDTVVGIHSYTVTATNGLCISKAYASVIVDKTPTQSYVTPKNAPCNGGLSTAIVTPVGGTFPYTYNWNTIPVQTSDTAKNLMAGMYSVLVKDFNGCISSETVTIVVPPPLSSTVSSTNLSCHSIPDGVATVFASGGTAGYTYCWNGFPTQTTATITGLNMGTYSATVTDDNGCNITTQVVTIFQPPAVILNAVSTGFSCAGTSPNGVTTAVVGGGTPGYSYLWMPGNKTSPSISNLVAGTYSVTITDSKGCSLSSVATITTNSKPDAKFSFSPVLSCDGLKITFTDESSPSSVSAWNWNFGDGQSSNTQNPLHAYKYDAGNYNVLLIVSDPPCFDTVNANIKMGDMLSYSIFEDANIFSPNGDNFNDCFSPSFVGVGASILKGCASLVVFDRWGVKMFESVGAINCWLGDNMNDSTPAVDGVYYYISTLGKTTIKGFVTLARNKNG
jgi:gliding motility-associated-like protein